MESYNSNANGSSMSTSNAPVSVVTDDGERTTNVINPNMQTIIPMKSYNSNTDNVTSNGTVDTDGSLMSTSNAPVSVVTDNGERTTNVINPNTQPIIPENEGEVRDTEVHRRSFIHQHRVVGQAISEFPEHAHAGFRAIPPWLSINPHLYEATNSTCRETKEHCCICLEEYSDREEVARIDCGHIYHMNCLEEWNKIENTCPICRRRVAVIRNLTLRFCVHLGRLAATNQISSGSMN